MSMRSRAGLTSKELAEALADEHADDRETNSGGHYHREVATVPDTTSLRRRRSTRLAGSIIASRQLVTDEPWQPSTPEERAAAKDYIRRAREQLALASGQVTPEMRDHEQAIRDTIEHDFQPRVIENRQFDLPIGIVFDDDSVKAQVDNVYHWLEGTHAIEDVFGTSTEGDRQREQRRNQILADGEVAKKVWQEMFGTNKFRINSLIMPALHVKNITAALSHTLGIQHEAAAQYLDRFSELYDSIYPYDEIYEQMSYAERLRFVQQVEDAAVDYLWSLQRLTLEIDKQE